MTDMEHDMNIETIAASLYRLVQEQSWRFATARQRQNYMAIARKTVADVQDEQRRKESA